MYPPLENSTTRIAIVYIQYTLYKQGIYNSYTYINAKIFFHCKSFSVGSQEEPDLEIQAFKICDTNEDDALTWQEVEDCEVCKY